MVCEEQLTYLVNLAKKALRIGSFLDFKGKEECQKKRPN